MNDDTALIYERPNVHLEIPMLHGKLGHDFAYFLHEAGGDPVLALQAHIHLLRGAAAHLEQLAIHIANAGPDLVLFDGDVHWISLMIDPELAGELLAARLAISPEDADANTCLLFPPGTLLH